MEELDHALFGPDLGDDFEKIYGHFEFRASLSAVPSLVSDLPASLRIA